MTETPCLRLLSCLSHNSRPSRGKATPEQSEQYAEDEKDSNMYGQAPKKEDRESSTHSGHGNAFPGV